MKQFFMLVLLLLWGFIQVESRQYQRCNREKITALYGEISYRRPASDRLNNEECEWNFLFDNSRDFALVMDFAYVYRGSHENNSIRLPNENVLKEPIQFPSCQVYFNSSSPLSECLTDLIKLYCTETPIPTTSWPPQMFTRNHRHSSMNFEMSYVVLTCLDEKSKKLKSEKTTVKVVVEKQVYAGLATLAGLLLLCLVALLILLIKHRNSQSTEDSKFRRNGRNSTENHLRTNRSYEDVPPHSFGSILDLSTERTENTMTNNIIYHQYE